MHEEYGTAPAVKAAIALAVAVIIAIAAQASGFVDVASVFGGDGDEVVDDPSTSTVPGTLAFEEASKGTSGTSASGDVGVELEDPSGGDSAATRPTVVESIELNPEVTLVPTTTTVAGQTSTTNDLVEETSTTTTEDPGDDVDPDDTIPPQFDENGDPIPVPDDEQPTENEPVRRTYNDYDGGSS